METTTLPTLPPKRGLFRRILSFTLIVLGVLVMVATVFVLTYRPAHRPAPDLTIERTAERVDRGRYLVENVASCMQCHSDRNWTRYGGPAGTDRRLAGGECFASEQGFPGTLCAPNLTPDPETGLGAWSDGEILRALREGVDRNGRALFPMMPYSVYREFSDSDAAAIVAYLRTIEPVHNPLPATEIAFPVSFFIKTMPEPLTGPVEDRDRMDTVDRGELLAHVAGCEFCHTPVDEHMDPLPGMAFAGGQEFEGTFGSVRSANLTPHASGMGMRSRNEFIGIFKAFAGDDWDDFEIEPHDNTPMPWTDFAQMTEEDLGAIYDYLQTVAPVDHPVVKRGP
ncbi:MAG: cytochrome c [Thermoanaerobaculia bacterium]|nr:cytochrome c [Thermoanaerobaculia bacterium]